MTILAFITICAVNICWSIFYRNLKVKSRMIASENQGMKASLELRNNILDALPCPVWVRDKNGRTLYSNARFKHIARGSDKSKNNDADLEISKQESQLLSSCYQSFVSQAAEFRIIVDNERCLYKFFAIPLRNNDAALGFAYDYMGKDKARNELEKHLAVQSDLLESTSSSIAIYGGDKRLKFFNQAFVKLWHLDEKWLITQPTYDLILDTLREKRKIPEQVNFQNFKNDQLALFTSITETYNDFMYLPDGRSIRVIIVPNAFGGLLFSYEDITDKLALERSYKTVLAVQRETIDSLTEGVAVFSESGKLQISNKKFESIWHFDKSDLENKPHIAVLLKKMCSYVDFSEKDFNEMFVSYLNLRKTSTIRLEKNDGAIIDILFVPLPDGSTLISYHDVTDSILVEKSLREKNEALEEVDKLKTKFLASMSYELRSPLTSIMGFSEILANKYAGSLNDKQEEYVKLISDSSNQLMSLITDILDIASINAGYAKLELSRFDIYEVMHGVAKFASEIIKEHKTQLQFVCDENIGEMFGDVKRLKQVVFKLIVVATEPAGEIANVTLSIEKEDNNVIFQVYNESMLGGDNQMHNEGINLSIVKSFVELHHGVFESQNSSEKGMSFKCTIPSVSLTVDDSSAENKVRETVSV